MTPNLPNFEDIYARGQALDPICMSLDELERSGFHITMSLQKDPTKLGRFPNLYLIN